MGRHQQVIQGRLFLPEVDDLPFHHLGTFLEGRVLLQEVLHGIGHRAEKRLHLNAIIAAYRDLELLLLNIEWGEFHGILSEVRIGISEDACPDRSMSRPESSPENRRLQ